MNVLAHNRAAWNQESLEGSRWTTPVGPEVIARARAGDWDVILTPVKPTPKAWLGELPGKIVLCLASGGGQQAPILAAAGAQVVSFDLSEEQLLKDRQVAERDGLDLTCVRGDMADLSEFGNEQFDLIFHPTSNVYAPDVEVVWRECFRVLRPGGRLLAGFLNPSFFLFDHAEAEVTGKLVAQNRLPYSDVEQRSISGKRRDEIDDGAAFEFGHSLETQIGGQLKAGFLLAGLYEDWWLEEVTPLNRLSPTTVATLALKPH
jgi:SAM-dependent methyltransferase